MKKSRIVALVATLGLAASAAVACGSGGGSGSDGSVLQVWGSEPQNPLFPSNTTETGGSDIIRNIFTGLVDYEVDGTPKNAIAESITPNSDASVFEITLKDGWTFSDGTPVTAHSFVDAWNFGAAAVNAQQAATFFENIKGYPEVAAENATVTELSGLTVKDDLHFTVELINPQADFPIQLGYNAFYPLPKVAFEDVKAFGEHPIGNGAYKLANDTAWQHNVQIELVPNESFGGEAPVNDGVTIIFYTDSDAAYSDLQSGRLDFPGYTVGPSALSTFETDFPDSHHNAPMAGNTTLTISSEAEHFGPGEEGKLRRQAISMAIDRAQITKTIFNDTRTPATDFASPAIYTGAELSNAENLTLNPERAKELWAQADAISPWSGTFPIAYNADGGHEPWVTAVANNLKNTLGIEAEGQPIAVFSQYLDEMKAGKLTAFRQGWLADFPSVTTFFGPLYGTGKSSNYGNYSSPEVDRLLAQIDSEPDEAKRADLIKEVQEVLADELPAIPLWVQNSSTAWNPELSGVEVAWDGYPDYTKISK